MKKKGLGHHGKAVAGKARLGLPGGTSQPDLIEESGAHSETRGPLKEKEPQPMPMQPFRDDPTQSPPTEPQNPAPPAPSTNATTRIVAATVYTPFNRHMTVDQDAGYPNVTYKEQ